VFDCRLSCCFIPTFDLCSQSHARSPVSRARKRRSVSRLRHSKAFVTVLALFGASQKRRLRKTGFIFHSRGLLVTPLLKVRERGRHPLPCSERARLEKTYCDAVEANNKAGAMFPDPKSDAWRDATDQTLADCHEALKTTTITEPNTVVRSICLARRNPGYSISTRGQSLSTAVNDMTLTRGKTSKREYERICNRAEQTRIDSETASAAFTSTRASMAAKPMDTHLADYQSLLSCSLFHGRIGTLLAWKHSTSGSTAASTRSATEIAPRAETQVNLIRCLTLTFSSSVLAWFITRNSLNPSRTAAASC
jgi:hypothetical protein